MKKVFLTILTLTLINFSYSQIDYGVKAGLNYNFGGDLKEVISEVGNNTQNIITGADAKAGFHVGMWSKFNFSGLYLRPELIYTELNNTYGTNPQSVDRNEADFKTKKIDIPVLVGAKIGGPLHVFAGPSLQYITNTKFAVNDLRTIKTNDVSIGLQLGAGVNLGRLGLDVRWEKGFNNDADGRFLDTDFNVDNRPNQIIFGLSYRLNENRD